MPKVLYFGLWGRGAASRLLLKHKGIEFDDQNPGKDDIKAWPELKAEFPNRGGLPWYTNDKGEVFTQSQSILRALAAEHGYTADGAWGEYESNYTIDVLNDASSTPGFTGTFFAGDDATEEAKTKAKEVVCKALDILDARWADGRKYCAGDKVTAGDFQLLANDVGLMNNVDGAKNKTLA